MIFLFFSAHQGQAGVLRVGTWELPISLKPEAVGRSPNVWSMWCLCLIEHPLGWCYGEMSRETTIIGKYIIWGPCLQFETSSCSGNIMTAHSPNGVPFLLCLGHFSAESSKLFGHSSQWGNPTPKPPLLSVKGQAVQGQHAKHDHT